MTALIADLSLTLANGDTLSDRTDVGLARQWAMREHGSDAWAALTVFEQNVEVADALTALRAAFATTV